MYLSPTYYGKYFDLQKEILNAPPWGWGITACDGKKNIKYYNLDYVMEKKTVVPQEHPETKQTNTNWS